MATVDIGEVLNSGFQLWKSNLILAVPFILGTLISSVVAIIIIVPTMMAMFLPYIRQTLMNPTVTQPQAITQQILTTFVQNIWLFLALIIIIAIIDGFIISYFYAGAIGMAKEAIRTGRTNLQHMMSHGRKKFISYFGASILTGLVLLVGILFLIPGFLNIIANANVLTLETATSAQIAQTMVPLILGSLAFLVYALPMSIVLFLVSYAVVLDDVGSFEGFRRGIRMFMRNKGSTFILWLLIFAGALILGFLSIIPFIGGIFMLLLMLLVYLPLITLWSSKLYLTATEIKAQPHESFFHTQ